MDKYNYQKKPFIVPSEDGKIIEEHFGLLSTNTDAYSIAHMIAPPGWSEPFQQPEFDEITFVISGRKMIEIDKKEIELIKNESILIEKGSTVRYSNPFEEECEYISICIPAFSPKRAHRSD